MYVCMYVCMYGCNIRYVTAYLSAEIHTIEVHQRGLTVFMQGVAANTTLVMHAQHIML